MTTHTAQAHLRTAQIKIPLLLPITGISTRKSLFKRSLGQVLEPRMKQ